MAITMVMTVVETLVKTITIMTVGTAIMESEMQAGIDGWPGIAL